MLYYGLHILFRHRRPLHDLADDLLIIVGKAQFFREPAAELSASAPEFSSDRNDSVHTHSFLSVLSCLVYFIISWMT